MNNWSPKALAKRVTLIGDKTVPAINVNYFSNLKQTSFITTDFIVLPYDLAEPIEATDQSVLIGEKKMPLLLGYKYEIPEDGRIVYSYDHHGPDIRMHSLITSTTLAQEVMRRTPLPFSHVFGTHVDADSLLSWFVLLTGNLDERLSAAAIAADHTGVEDPLADLLQSITELRNVEFSFECLKAFMNHESLPYQAKELLQTRLRDRERAFQYVKNGLIEHVGNGIYIGNFEEMVPGELFPALIPNAKVIVLISPLSVKDLKEIKIRAGYQFPKGISLNQLGLPDYGGRWNAGSTKRSGGTNQKEVENFLALLKNALIPLQ